jgi:hypothetical protein
MVEVSRNLLKKILKQLDILDRTLDAVVIEEARKIRIKDKSAISGIKLNIIKMSRSDNINVMDKIKDSLK